MAILKDYGEKAIACVLEKIREKVAEDERAIFGKNKVEIVLRISFGGRDGLPTLIAEDVNFKHELRRLADDLRQAVKDFHCHIAEAKVEVINERQV